MCVAQGPVSTLKLSQEKEKAVPVAAASSSGGIAKTDAMRSSRRHQNKHARIIVRHNYHDHANAPPPAVDQYASLARSGVNTAFPLKLYDMLERVEAEGFSSIVSWSPHGRCFVVHDSDKFRALLPRYFKLSKIASFQRQLNLYGFTRISSGPDRNGYYHERFLRGKPFLIEHMTRSKVKGTCVRARANPREEPDFYKMTWVGCDQQQKRQQQIVPSMMMTLPLPHGSSSVVSHDEDSHHYEDDEIDCEPLPVSFATPLAQELQQQGGEEDVVISGWGMPFHYLGSLPEDLVASAPTPAQTSSLTGSVVIEPTPIGSDVDIVVGVPQLQQQQRADDNDDEDIELQYDDFEKLLSGMLDDDRVMSGLLSTFAS